MLLSATVGFAQASLIVVWLLLGSAHLVRRVPWSLCALSGLALAYYSGPPLAVDNFGVAYVLARVITVAVFVLPLRLLHYRLMQPPAVISSGDSRRSSQFSILDLLIAAFAVALAGAIVIRIQPPAWVFSNVEVIRALITSAFGKLWPFALITVIAIAGVRSHRWLSLQVIFSGSIAILPFSFVNEVYGEHRVWLSFSSHWFLVGGTLWIFQMCGYRLVRLERRNHDD